MSVNPMQAQEQILVNTCISFKHIIDLILALNMWPKLLPNIINSPLKKWIRNANWRFYVNDPLFEFQEYQLCLFLIKAQSRRKK